MISRRNAAKAIPMFLTVGALAACASSNTTPGSTSRVPTLAEVQTWVAIVNSELPAFIAQSEASGVLPAAAYSKAQQALAVFQALAAQFLAPTFNATNTSVIVSEIGTALTTILSAIPVTVPYVGFIQLAVLVISAFIAASPIVVPPLPSSASLSAMHNVH